jgi:gamma-glutamyltranspeptidase/glutathione hydrolase
VTPPTNADADHTVSDHPVCTELGNDILGMGGNSVDAAVAATFCMAVVAPHLTGIGGGGMMLIHINRKNESVVIDFRETAPNNARNER